MHYFGYIPVKECHLHFQQKYYIVKHHRNLNKCTLRWGYIAIVHPKQVVRSQTS